MKEVKEFKSMTEDKILELNQAVVANDHDLFEELAGEFTARELEQLTERLHKDFVYMIWRCSTSWGFEVTWSSYLTMTEEKKKQILEEFPDHDFSVPSNFNGNIPLKDLFRWAPQDQTNRLYA